MSTIKERVSKTCMEYMYNLGITPADLKGKMVLDIGAETGVFAKYVEQELQGDIKIYSIDESPVKGNYKVEQMSTKKLRFKTQEFDLVISHAAFPNMLQKNQNLLSEMLEVLRTVKSGGKVILAPVIYKGRGERDYRPEVFQATMKTLEWMKFEVNEISLGEGAVRIVIQSPK